MRDALRALDARVRADFRRGVLCAVLAFAADAVAHAVGGVHAHSLRDRLIAYVCTAAFVVLGITATRSVAGELTRVSLHRAGPSAANPLRVATLLLGYLIVAVSGLDLFAVPVGKLLVGGAVTGVILGIAAQQSLSNLFAGLVLLFARPYVPGEAIRVRSGALGGSLDGVVTTVGLMYTTLDTADGIVNIPNGALLAAAVGPRPPGTTPAGGPPTGVTRSNDAAAADGTGRAVSSDPPEGGPTTAHSRPRTAHATQQLPPFGTVAAETDGSAPGAETDAPGPGGSGRWSSATVVGGRSGKVSAPARPADGDVRAPRPDENATETFARFQP